MKALKLFFLLILPLALFTACDKEGNNLKVEADYLIFGHAYGFCVGEKCIEIFKLEDGQLYEDANDNYPGSTDFYDADFSTLSNELYEQVSNLEDDFPSILLDETDTVIGEPDAGDWGGLYIEYKAGDFRKFWLLDLNKNNVPESYHNFIDAVTEKIELINE